MSRKIISTIGPNSYDESTLKRLKDEGTDYFRINLSHTSFEDIESQISYLSDKGLPLIVDTEGPQVRTGNLEDISFVNGSEVKIYDSQIDCDSQNLSLTPKGILHKLKKGSEIYLAFGSAHFTVKDTSNLNEGYVLSHVNHGGTIGSRKAVHIQNTSLDLPPFSYKDLKAIEFAKSLGVKHFTLSFMEDPSFVEEIRGFYPEAVIYSKIESKKGLDNLDGIADVSDGILIDRGDLSSDISIQKVPFVQKYIIERVRSKGLDVFVATDTLQNMFDSPRPNAADANDMVNTLLDGATGIALTKETAVGKHPVETVQMLRRIMTQVDTYTTHKTKKDLEFLEELIRDPSL